MDDRWGGSSALGDASEGQVQQTEEKAVKLVEIEMEERASYKVVEFLGCLGSGVAESQQWYISMSAQ